MPAATRAWRVTPTWRPRSQGSKHAQVLDKRTPAAQQNCESCHGPGQAHVDDDAKGHILKFAQASPAEASAACLNCHSGGAHAGWQGSTHEARNLTCTTCHSVHHPVSAAKQLVKNTETQLCATCHRTQVTKTERAVAHMPVREGKMSCSSCHNPHGSISNVKALRTGSSVAESCSSCHTEMRGPVLWEHTPVRENCATCHDPHGSSNDRMLVVRQPMLCQRCHIAQKHPATMYDKDEITVKKSNRMFGRSCVNCHSNVHGSNHPSRPVLHAIGDTVMRAVTPALILSLVLLPSAMVVRSAAGTSTGGRQVSSRRRRLHQRRRAPAAAAPPDDTRSLFEQTWRQFQIGGRISSVEGDPARWQRYRDLRDGVLFTNARYEHVWAATGQLFQVAADNVGWRDGRYVGVLERQGRFAITGSWDGIPQFYSVDTKTPYVGDGATLTLDDATQRSIQNAQSTLSAYVPQAPQFDLVERRDTGIVGATINPTTQLQLTTSFKTQKHAGELPWGASFGFSNDVEVALPYTSRTNDFNLGAEWKNQRNMLRVAYDGSWFNNNDDTLVWDSPLRLDDSSVERPAAAGCRCGRPTRPTPSASPAPASSRRARSSPASSPMACGRTTPRCSPTRSTASCR